MAKHNYHGIYRLRTPRKFSGFVIQNTDTKLYWCGKHTWVSTMTRARHFDHADTAETKTGVIRVQENYLGMRLIVLSLGEAA